jgi:two-component system OmpR family response regulator
MAALRRPMPTKTFLVEDSETIRAHLVPAMRDLADVEVIATAESEGEAVAWLASHTGDLQLAVVDLLLKEGSGLGVAKHIRRVRPDLPVAILTNYATPSTRDRALAAGASAVFDKSTELEDFFAYCMTLQR